MYDGFVERAEAVSRTIADRRTTFVVVSTLEDAPVREAEFFMQALVERELHLGALVLNKVLPPWFADEGAAEVAQRLVRDSTEVAAALAHMGVAHAEGAAAPEPLGDPVQVARVLREIGQSFDDYRIVATREREQAAVLSRHPELVVSAPHLDHDISDLGGLIALGRALW